MKINPNIFRGYDIRGVYPNELNDETAYIIGRSFADYVKSSPIIVGYDARLSSPSLRGNVIKGIIDQGIDVIDIGLCSTSCFYYTVGKYQSGGGIMITASHFEKKFNGFKFVFSGNMPLTKEQILEIKKIFLKNQFLPASPKGAIIKKNPADEYVQAVRKAIKKEFKSLKVIMDAGNGTAGLYLEKVFSGTSLSVVPIFIEPDGNFPSHETDPKISENRKKLAEKIISEKADLGFMFDGDADRMGVLDRNGNLINFSLVLAIISEFMVRNSSQKKIVCEVRTSRVVNDWVEKAGGSVEISSCWTIPIKLKIKNNPQIVFGGETSGHFIFPELYATDDGIMSSLVFLQALSSREETIDEIIKKFNEKYFVLEETNFKIDSKEKADGILENLEKKYAAQGAKIIKIDGLSAVLPGWWFNLRKSESEPLIRLNLEANNKNLFEEKKEEIIRLIKNV